MELTPDLPLVRGQRIQLQQLLLNLMLNAIDALQAVTEHRRGLTVRVASGKHGAAIVIHVIDNGPGITEEIMNRLFAPFVTNKANGIGLGLPLCRSITERHGGTIQAHSVPGQGACFEVTLPVMEGG
ncbi:MAG: ATP-binding protein [Methylococcaceae bacterium]|nr:ATP-binding protein [Methylococcaceae bacterium]